MYFLKCVWSPNTPGLRNLQKKKDLTNLLSNTLEARNKYCGERKIPLLLKISPDLTDQDKNDIVNIINDKKVKFYFHNNIIFCWKLILSLIFLNSSIELMDW